MKVLHMLQSNRFSGAENVVCQIIKMLDSEFEFVYSSQDGQIREALSERGIPFNPVKEMSVSEFRRVIKEEKPDVIHAHDMKASFYASLACGKIPLISHVHNNNFDSRKITLKSILYYFAARKARHIFWVSKSSFEGYRFHNVFSSKSTVLYNIIDIGTLEKKMNLDTNQYPYEVVFLGRLTPPKNPQRLIQVFGRIAQKRPETKMAIVGTGELEQECKVMAREEGLEGNVTFMGFQNNPYKILHDAKVMIMTSRWEGTPMCALEAMALGVPIVSTPTDGLKELVVDGKTGYLSDNDEGLVERVIQVVSDNKIYRIMSENAMQKAKTMMRLDSYMEQICSVYLNK